MPSRLELRRVNEVAEDPFKFNAPPLDVRVRLAVVPPPGIFHLGRVHRRFVAAERASEHRYRHIAPPALYFAVPEPIPGASQPRIIAHVPPEVTCGLE